MEIKVIILCYSSGLPGVIFFPPLVLHAGFALLLFSHPNLEHKMHVTATL